MPNFRLQLISESSVTYEFEDVRSLKDLSDGVVREGYLTFEGISNRLGNANQGKVRQTVFSANIARIVER